VLCSGLVSSPPYHWLRLESKIPRVRQTCLTAYRFRLFRQRAGLHDMHEQAQQAEKEAKEADWQSWTARK
jgi:hypothetical protein